jgi:hypothetical protein
MALSRRINFRNAAADVRAWLKQVRLSTAEIVALVTLLVFCAFVVWFHLSKVRPKTAELDALAARENVALAQLRRANDEKKRFEDEKSNSGKIIGSIDSFEHLLKYREEGTPQIVSEVNHLAALSNAEARDFAYRLVASETAETKSPTGAAEREDKLNVFTALGIDTTAVGSYSNLRRLIESIERSPQFIVIDAIAFQGEAEASGRARPAAIPAGVPAVPAPGPGPGTAPVQARVSSAAARTPGKGGEESLVSLRIEMETYFRRKE